MIPPGIGSGTKSQKPVPAISIGYGPTGSKKVGIDRGIVLILSIHISSRCVRLPDLDHRVAQPGSVKGAPVREETPKEGSFVDLVELEIDPCAFAEQRQQLRRYCLRLQLCYSLWPLAA